MIEFTHRDFTDTGPSEAQRRTLVALDGALAEAVLGPRREGETDAERLQKARAKAPQLFSDAKGAVLGAVNNPSPWGGIKAGWASEERPSGLDWTTLRKMSMTTVVAPIIQVLLGQIAKFFAPSDNPYEPGFRVRLRDKRAVETRAAREMCSKIERYMMQLGVQRDPRESLIRPSFQAFGMRIARDSLTYDWGAVETIRPRAARHSKHAIPPVAFRALDASTIRLTAEAMDPQGIRFDDFKTPIYVQVAPSTLSPVAQFTPEQLFVGVRNPGTWMDQFGYGVSELEMAVGALTGWLNAFARNSKYFEQGFSARGILVAKGEQGGKLNPQAVSAFKSDLQALATGVQGSHRLPFVEAADLSFLALGNEATDAQWTNFADLCLKLLCALYGVEPASINFLYGNTGQSGAMGSADSNAREQATRTRAVIPKVKAIFGWLDRCLVQQIDPDFVIEPTGVHTDESGDYKRASEFMQAGATFNEAREKLGLPPRDDGDFIGSNTGMQAAGMMMGDEGMGGMEGEQAEPLDAGDLMTPEDDERSPGDAMDAGQTQDDTGPLRRSMRPVRRRVTVTL